MTPREIKAVSEALAKEFYKENMMMEKYTPETYTKLYAKEFEEEAQAAIAASDSQYVKGLVEALKEIEAIGSPTSILASIALQQLPEDLR